VSAAPAAAGEHIRLSPADGRALHKNHYELRGRDGKLICTVRRDRAAAGIAAGALELWHGPSGAYLRAVGLAYPEHDRHHATGSRVRAEPPRGAVAEQVWSHVRAASGQVGGIRRGHSARRLANRSGPARPPAA
jgi:hypothetical protein